MNKFYINQIVKVLPDKDDVDLPDYGIVNRKDEGYNVPIAFNFSRYGQKWWVIRSRVTKSDRSDL